MASSFTTNKRIEKPGNNDYVNTWNVPVNANFDAIDQALGGVTFLNATGAVGTVTLLDTQYRSLMLFVSGAQTGNAVYSLPAGVGGMWVVRNTTTGGSHTVTIASAGGGASVAVPRGINVLVFSDGTGLGSIASVAGSNTQVIFNANGVFTGASNFTFDGTTLSAPQLDISGGGTLNGNYAGDGDIDTSGDFIAERFLFTRDVGKDTGIAWQSEGTFVGVSNGNVRFTFAASGDFTAVGNVTAFSDARVKTDVETIDHALELVERMRGVRYTRTDTGHRGVGVIAQEMREALPEVVVETEGKLSVAYGNISGVLIEAIKALSARVKELEAR